MMSADLLKYARGLAMSLALLSLAGCGILEDAKQSFARAKAAERTLKSTTGQDVTVGFDSTDGRLKQVSVLFPRPPEQPMPELAKTVRAAIQSSFETEPDVILIMFRI